MRALPLLLFAAVLLAGCDGGLSAARARWRERGTSHYTYLHETSGFLPHTLTRIEVENGVVSRVTDEGTPDSRPPTTPLPIEYAPTVIDLFVTIFHLEGEPLTSATVTYDDEFGYPTEIAARNSSEQWWYTSSELTPLE